MTLTLRRAAGIGAALLCILAWRGSIATAQVAPTAKSASADLEKRLAKLAESLEKQRQELHIAGMAIAVVKDDRVILAKGFGHRDVEAKTPADPETIFAIGSSTKAFTAMLAGMLADEGKMTFDDPIVKHLPDFKLKVERGGPIEALRTAAMGGAEPTLRDLLAHRTGFGRADLAWSTGRLNRDEVLQVLIKAKPMGTFRKDFHYCNIGFLAAGVAEGKAAGMEWDDLLAKRIFEPLGMKNSTVSLKTAQADPRLSKGYDWDESAKTFRVRKMRDLTAIAPAGAINSNVNDMSRWLRFLLAKGKFENKTLVQAKMIDEMWKRSHTVQGDVGYGLGWMLRKVKGRSVVEHGGNIDGFAAEVALVPEDRLGFVLLTNVSFTPLQTSSIDLVVDAILGAADDEKSAKPKDDAKPAAGSEEDMGPYVGKYIANYAQFKDTPLTVTAKDGKLFLDVPGQMNFELKPPGSDGRRPFALTNTIAVSFARGKEKDAKAYSLTIHQGGADFESPREGAEYPIEIPLDDLKKYVGVYDFPQQKVEVAAKIVRNRLALDIPKQTVYELFPPDKDGKWAFRALKNVIQVKFEEDKAGKVTGISMFQAGQVFKLPRKGDLVEPALPTADEALALIRKGWGASARPDARMRLVSKISLPHQGVDGKQIMVLDGTERHREELKLGKIGKVIETYSDGKAWKQEWDAPAEPVSGEELAAARRSNLLRDLESWRQDYDVIKVAGKSKEGNLELIKIELSGKNSAQRTVYADAKTGEIVRSETRTPVKGLGHVNIIAHHSDFRTVDGWRLPFRTRLEVPATGEIHAELETAEIGVEIPKGTFDPPASSPR